MGILNWPAETVALPSFSPADFTQADSNFILDFHGDPLGAAFCLFSDGNHHMALSEVITAFCAAEPKLSKIFYLTLPPPALLKILHAGSVRIANIQFPLSADMIISPSGVLQKLQQSGVCREPEPFISGQGYAWLVAKSNSKQFNSTHDLLRDDIRLFISNPDTEKVSYDNYRSAILSMGAAQADIKKRLQEKIDRGLDIEIGQCIHHREAPESIAQGRADVSLLYYHLALRFSRVFPQYFDLLITPEIEKLNQSLQREPSQIQMALIGDGGAWGQKAVNFFQTKEVADIYQKHGLRSET